jgi:AcrR family transcriptional regulator
VVNRPRTGSLECPVTVPANSQTRDFRLRRFRNGRCPSASQETDASRRRRESSKTLSARAVFAEYGIDVTLDEIVRHSGHGVGTFYRHFRNRDELLDELFEESVSELEDVFKQAVDETGDAWTIFERLMESLLETMTKDRSLWYLAIRGSSRDTRLDRLEHLYQRYLPELLKRAQASGKLRGDIGDRDMAIIQGMMLHALNVTYLESPGAAQRYLGILLDGLRTRRSKPSVLSAPEPTREEMVASMRRYYASSRP